MFTKKDDLNFGRAVAARMSKARRSLCLLREFIGWIEEQSEIGHREEKLCRAKEM
jgi:hypothetical protein